jgi:ATP-binding cassette, subfamily B, multidrug efflux pump
VCQLDPKSLLWQFLFARKWAYFLSFLSIVASECVTVQFPNILGNFTNALEAKRLSAHSVMVYAMLLLMVGVGYVLLYAFGQYRNGALGRDFEYLLRKHLFAKWESLSTSYFRQRSIGDLLNHALNDVRQVRDAMAGGLNILTNAIFLLAAALFMTFRTVSVKLTLVSMIPLCFIPFFIVWWGPRVRGASRQVQEALSDMADLTEESLTAIRLIKATANENVEAARFQSRVDKIVSRQMTVFKESALFQSMVPLMGSLSFSIALLYGGYMTLNHQIQLGAFVAFTLYLAMVLQPIAQIGFVINNFQRASASLARLHVLLNEKPDIQNPEHPKRIQSIQGKIQVCLSSFKYKDGQGPVLQDIVFSVGQGQTIGIVGRTGSGKTTLVNLIPRIFDPPEGSIFVDGVDVRDMSMETLREAIAYVPQDGFLFSSTIGENIGFSNEHASKEEIMEAARAACIDSEIERFSEEYDTLIGERGVTLSGGQKQRTALARAFLKDAPILIMDDSLSAVDMATEKNILSNLKKIRQGKTTIIIAHRLSAVRHANWILVLNQGRIIEQGTHESLLALSGQYAEIYQMQQAGEEASV